MDKEKVVILNGDQEIEIEEVKKESKLKKFGRYMKENWEKYFLGALTGVAFTVGAAIMLAASELEETEEESENFENSEMIFDAVINDVEEAENDAVEE